MLLPFFTALRDAKVPVSMKEWLHLMEAMDKGVASGRVEDFYHLSRAVLVKDEKHYDRFDQVFGKVFKGLETVGAGEAPDVSVPEDWLKLLNEKYLTDEEKAQIEALKCIAGGDRIAAAAAKLGISESALKARITSARIRLMARTTAEAIQRAATAVDAVPVQPRAGIHHRRAGLRRIQRARGGAARQLQRQQHQQRLIHRCSNGAHPNAAACPGEYSGS